MISPPPLVTTSRIQRRTESPVFWAVVFASSLLIHIGLALGIRSLLLQTVQPPGEPEPIAVEFADTDASSPQPKQPSQPSSQVIPSNPPASQPSEARSRSSPADPSSTSLPSTLPSSEVAPATPEPVRSVQSPPPVPSAPSRPQSPAPPAPPPTPTNPIPNRVAPPNSAASSPNTRLSSPSPEGPIASGIRLPDVPGVPNPVNNPGATARSSNRPIAIPQTPTPTKFLAQVQLLPGVDQGAIANSTADAPAAIQGEPSKELISDTSTCLLTPEAVATFGKAVVLTVSLDEQGRLQGEPTILNQSSSGNSRYDELAACVLKQWTFSPAYDQVDQHTRSSKPATIRVQVKITE